MPNIPFIKAITAAALTFAALTTAPVTQAQTLTGVSVETQQPQPGQPLVILVDIDKGDKDTITCGALINFGDGNTRDLRIEGATFPLRVEYAYAAPGSFAVTIEGKTIFRGLRSAGACGGAVRSVVAQVGGAGNVVTQAPTVEPIAEAAPAAPVPVAQPRVVAPAQASPPPRVAAPAPVASPSRGATVAVAVEPTKPFRGKIIYQGSYTGRAILPAQGGSSVRGGAFNVFIPNTKTVDLAGAITIELEIEGQAVRGNFKTTGPLNPENFSGVLNAEGCTLHIPRGGATMKGPCGADGFVGVMTSPPSVNFTVNVQFQTTATKVEDYDERDRKQVEVAAQRRVAEAAERVAEAAERAERERQQVAQQELHLRLYREDPEYRKRSDDNASRAEENYLALRKSLSEGDSYAQRRGISTPYDAERAALESLIAEIRGSSKAIKSSLAALATFIRFVSIVEKQNTARAALVKASNR